jgi:tetratricopeptide (TPR) repeat protein
MRHAPHLLVAVPLLACLLAARADGSPRSAELLDQGSGQLAEGNFEQALATFDAAAREDPADPEAPFFAGVTLNRLGRADQALDRLARAESLGLNHPDMPFEKGWSLLMLRRWEPAVEQLTRYDAANPTRGQTSEFLGRAYLALGKYDQADAAFAEALRRDPDLAPTVRVYRALLHQRRGDETAARDELAGLLRGAPDSITGRVVRANLDVSPGRSSAAQRPWDLGLSLGMGYNSDARGISFVRPRNQERVPEEGSAFARIRLDGAYYPIAAARDRLTLGYQLQADFYAEQRNDPDLLDQYVYVEHWHALGDKFSATLRLSENYTLLGEDGYRNQLAAHAGLGWRVRPHLFVEGAYTYAYNDYLYDIRAQQNPPLSDQDVAALNADANVHTLTISAVYDLPKVRARIRGGYVHTWNLASGVEFDYHSDALFAGLTIALPWEIAADLFYVRNFDRYEHESRTVIPPVKRSDDIDGFTVRLTRAFTPHASAYVEYNYNHDNSNIDGYDIDQHVVSAGLAWRF